MQRGRKPVGGEVEVMRLLVEEPASEIASRLTRLETANPLEAARLRRIRSLSVQLTAEIDAEIEYDAKVENPHIEAASRCAYELLDAIRDWRQTIRSTQESELRGMVERMLGHIEKLATGTLPTLPAAA